MQSPDDFKRSSVGVNNPPKSAPTVLIMPRYRYILGFNLAPPGLEIGFGDVEGRRRDEVIEDDVVLFTPAESCQVVEVIVVKEVVSQRRREGVGGRIDEFGGGEKGRRREFGELQQRALRDARGDVFAYRIDEARNPFIIFRAVNPGREVAAAFHL